MAIGSDEHSGHVRAVGQAVPNRRYFHEPRQCRGLMTDEEMHRLMDIKVNSMKEQLLNDIHLKYRLRTPPHHEDDDDVGTRPCPQPKIGYGSCSSISKDLSKLPEGSFMCDLANDHDTDKLVVARGKAYNIGDGDQMIHCEPLGVDNVRVSISKPIVDGAPLPFPSGNIKFMGNDVIGSFFKWPKRLVIWDTKTLNKRKDVARLPSDGGSFPLKDSLSVNLPKHDVAKKRTSISLKALDTIVRMMTIGQVITVHMHAAIFRQEHDIAIDRSEILHFIGKKEIGAACIGIYMK